MSIPGGINTEPACRVLVQNKCMTNLVDIVSERRVRPASPQLPSQVGLQALSAEDGRQAVSRHCRQVSCCRMFVSIVVVVVVVRVWYCH